MTDADTREWVLGPFGDRELLGRSSTAERVADVLRTRIAEGYFEPGTRLPENAIRGALDISRNTLREAFRLLTRERLLKHVMNRGHFVRVLSLDDVIDLYRVRQIVECGVVGDILEPPRDLTAVREAVRAGKAAARSRDWQALGTANIRFHQAIAALSGSKRVEELMQGLLAELRLVFHIMADPRSFHEPYLVRNIEILQALEGGDGPMARQLLSAYLNDSLAQLVETFSVQMRGR
ncbi:GntR family transcriptional regulator [Flindersiella endophytica]